MAQQNFIAKALCSLGGDKYTKESTEASLQEAFQDAQNNIIHFDIQKDKWILFSDLHKGAKNGADDFWRCEEHYLAALKHYYKGGFNLCVMGDAEELWEEFPKAVIRKNNVTFDIEKRFHNEGRYMRLWGNHDEIWQDPKKVMSYLQPLYGHRHLDVPESVLMEVKDGDRSLGNILLIHGHQGTQNEGKNTGFSKWVLHNIWRPLQVITGFSCNTPATDWRLRRDRDKLIYHWVEERSSLVLIAGHTHAPVFASYTHRARLSKDLDKVRSKVEELPKNQRHEALNRAETLSSDLQHVESKLDPEERQEPEPLENPLPCYFNTGCCAFEDGDITGIEMSDGEIRLVRWPDDNNQPNPKVLQADTLTNVFDQLQ